MKPIRLSTWSAAGALVLAAVLAQEQAARSAFADERPKTSKAVQVPAQGGEGIAPIPGAPPSAETSLAARPAVGAALPSAEGALQVARQPTGPMSLRALSLVEGEATLEIDGVREVVRPGSRLGAHAVKSVVPGRIVLTRSSATGPDPLHVQGAAQTAGVPGHVDGAGPTVDGADRWEGAPLVIVTFDASGEGKARVFWTSDPAAPVPAEAKRP